MFVELKVVFPIAVWISDMLDDFMTSFEMKSLGETFSLKLASEE